MDHSGYIPEASFKMLLQTWKMTFSIVFLWLHKIQTQSQLKNIAIILNPQFLKYDAHCFFKLLLPDIPSEYRQIQDTSNKLYI